MDIYNESLRERYSIHKFIISPVGILRLVGGIFWLVSSILSVALQVCSQSSWLEISYPILIAASGVLTLLLYALTIIGIAKKMPVLWTKLEIIFSTIVVVVTLVFSILLLTNCKNGDSVTVVTGVMSIIGTLCVAATALIMFISWGNNGDVEGLPTPPDTNVQDFDPKRKSVFI